jgi:hypothetical protein
LRAVGMRSTVRDRLGTAIGHPVVGEMTVADLGMPGSPGYPSEYPGKVESWARSVAEHRFL